MKMLKVVAQDLTPKQIDELRRGGVEEIVELEVINPELASFLANSSDEWGKLNDSALKLIEFSKDYDAVLLFGCSSIFLWVLGQHWLKCGVESMVVFGHSLPRFVDKPIEKFIRIEGTDYYRLEIVIEKVAVVEHISFV